MTRYHYLSTLLLLLGCMEKGCPFSMTMMSSNYLDNLSKESKNIPKVKKTTSSAPSSYLDALSTTTPDAKSKKKSGGSAPSSYLDDLTSKTSVETKKRTSSTKSKSSGQTVTAGTSYLETISNKTKDETTSKPSSYLPSKPDDDDAGPKSSTLMSYIGALTSSTSSKEKESAPPKSSTPSTPPKPAASVEMEKASPEETKPTAKTPVEQTGGSSASSYLSSISKRTSDLPKANATSTPSYLDSLSTETRDVGPKGGAALSSYLDGVLSSISGKSKKTASGASFKSTGQIASSGSSYLETLSKETTDSTTLKTKKTSPSSYLDSITKPEPVPPPPTKKSSPPPPPPPPSVAKKRSPIQKLVPPKPFKTKKAPSKPVPIPEGDIIGAPIGTVGSRDVPFFATPTQMSVVPPRPIVRRKSGIKSRTQRIMEKTSTTQTGGAGGASTWDAFLRADDNWTRLKTSKTFSYEPKFLRRVQNGIPPPTPFITTDGAQGNPECWAALRSKTSLDFDVVVCGGTLGIFLATVLQMKGFRVGVIEAGKLRGREQEWNISRKELMELVELGVLTEEEMEEVITTEFEGCRSGFKNQEVTPLEGSYFENGIGYECFTPNVLNLGVSPSLLLEKVSDTFLSLGGIIFENSPLKGVCISEFEGAALDISTSRKSFVITSRLVLDCMGHASPISRQQRYGMKPDGVCAVVGSCAGGYDKSTNVIGDIIYTFTEIEDKGDEGKLQYFWESFPVGIGRNGVEPGSSDVKTTYMFTYMDADEYRPSLLTLMEDYWDLLPTYQPSISDPEKDLEVKRVLFAYFPTYRDSPLQPDWSRTLAVGDASGIQSPLSFGGFGALTRHLSRISTAISDALMTDCLHKEDLARINAYTPNLSVAWMFQKAMSIRIRQNPNPKFVNRLLATNFKIMNDMGTETMLPFLQDVVKIDGLAGSLARSFLADPAFMPQIIRHVGVEALSDWLGHVGMMATYTGLNSLVTPAIKSLVDKIEDPKAKFLWRRRMDAWKYGSGSDYDIIDVEAMELEE